MDRPTLTVAEAARALGISRQHAMSLIRRGQFPVRVIKIGKRWRVPAALIDELLRGAA